MGSAKLWLILRVCVMAGLVGLIALVFTFGGSDYARAATGSALFQSGYDVSTEAPYDVSMTDTPEANPTDENTMAVATVTIAQTATQVPDVFRTEDSEMGQSKTTPVITETPGPTMTMVQTPTSTKTAIRPTPTPIAIKEKDSLSMDWGMFLAGFSLPVVAACGYVLYLLDRRPELFKRSRH